VQHIVIIVCTEYSPLCKADLGKVGDLFLQATIATKIIEELCVALR
jgi:hypothetical protein